jgi:hypothetical protein
MALEVYFQDELLDGLVSDVLLVIETARHYNALNVDYLCGAISLAKARSISLGIGGSIFVERVRGELSQDNRKLLEAVL